MVVTKIVVLTVSFIATIFVWQRLLRFNEHPALKVAIAVIAVFPILGPLMGLWIVGMPDMTAPHLRATMNHRGTGGRFIGFGSGRFSYDDHSDPPTGEDVTPPVTELQDRERKKRRKK